MLDIIRSMLQDENGVSEQTYMHLHDYYQQIAETPIGFELGKILRMVDATDNRFYLSE